MGIVCVAGGGGIVKMGSPFASSLESTAGGGGVEVVAVGVAGLSCAWPSAIWSRSSAANALAVRACMCVS